jgi:cysteinyl-tRNA synthetase
MSMKYLGEQFDIHCGGIDHVSVHHTNEIAQSEAATGKKPWVRIWLHGEFLVLAKEKMAKSAGNFLTLRSLAEKGYDPLDYRYFCLGAHYRSPLQFSFEALDGARSGRQNIVERILRLKQELPEGRPADPESLGGKAADTLRSFGEELASDLNLPKALSCFWELIKDEELDPAERLAGALLMDRVLGLGIDSMEVPRMDPALAAEVEALIDEREKARRDKDFTRADRIRDQLRERGIVLEDTPSGTRWKAEKL